MLDVQAHDAVVLDLDGVVTSTARVHARAWRETFDAYLRERDPEQPPFDSERDYKRYVDGKPRYEGVESFLASRGITLPHGGPDDPPEADTVCGLGNRKNRLFLEHLREEGVEPFADAVDFLRTARRVGMRTAAISASRNARHVLAEAGLEELFDVRVDGVVARERGLEGKPGIVREAIRRLEVEPARAVLFEDAIAGVEAGREAGCGRVVGVARRDGRAALEDAGADAVIRDFTEVPLLPPARPIDAVPPALEAVGEIAAAAGGRRTVLFLDYDGTLTPIVARPEDADLDGAMRVLLQRLARRRTIAIVSGRDLDDLRGRVGLEGLYYAGSHGFRLAGPDGWRNELPRSREFLPALQRAGHALAESLGAIDGAQVERKRYAIAIHYRRVAPERVDDVRAAVERVQAESPELRTTEGRKVLELRPALDWDKGRAVHFVLDALGLAPRDAFAVYVGDDLTDEDAFEAVSAHGAGVLVRGRTGRTRARWALDDTGAVARFLDALDAELGRP